MLKGLFWGLILLVAWGLFRSRNRSARPAPPPAGGTMVACALCRVYLPEGEAVREEGNTFCCPAHYEQWKRRS